MFIFKMIAFSLGIVGMIGLIECIPQSSILKPKKVIIKSTEYNYNKDLVFMKITVRDGPNGVPVADLDAELFQDIPGDLYVNNIIYRKVQGEYRPVLKTGLKSACEFLKNPEKEPILHLLLSRLKQFGNLEFSCPMLKGKFRVDGFFIDGSNLPQGTPSGEYKLELVIDRKVDGKDILIFDMVWFATIQPIDA